MCGSGLGTSSAFLVLNYQPELKPPFFSLVLSDNQPSARVMLTKPDLYLQIRQASGETQERIMYMKTEARL